MKASLSQSAKRMPHTRGREFNVKVIRSTVWHSLARLKAGDKLHLEIHAVDENPDRVRRAKYIVVKLDRAAALEVGRQMVHLAEMIMKPDPQAEAFGGS